MLIDINKSARKKAIHAVESALSWQGWNSANPMHPKGSDGRWVAGHPFVGILGDAPDHIHHLSDEDLEAANRHVTSLATAMTAEISRRGVSRAGAGRMRDRIPASRTYGGTPSAQKQRGTTPKLDFSTAEGTQEALAEAHRRAPEKPAKPLRATRTRANPSRFDDIAAGFAQAHERPMPSDLERFRVDLQQLTLPQLKELAERHHLSSSFVGRNKVDKINSLIQGGIGHQLNHTAKPASSAQDIANARAIKRFQDKVDKLKERLHVARMKSREEQRRTQSDQEVGLANDLRKAEDELREAKRKAGTLPDTRQGSETRSAESKPFLGIKPGETGEQAVARYRQEYEASPRGQREAARFAQQPRVEALAGKIRRSTSEEEIIRAIEEEKLTIPLLKDLADQFNIDLGADQGRGQRAVTSKVGRTKFIADTLAAYNRRGGGSLGGVR